MATTAKPIDILAAGLRDTSGAALASAQIRFYAPGTLVSRAVYSDSACTTALSQPVTANAGGQATVYALEAVRMIAKDSTDTTTYYDGIVNLQRADSVYVTVDGINSGDETTLEEVLDDIGDSFGDGFLYKESSTATSRTYLTVIRNIAIQAADYGVVADGTTDDTTALQNAINRVETLGGGRVLLPTGTILISSAVTIDTAGVSIEGNGRGMSIIKQSSTTANGINVTLSSGDAKLYLKGFTVTASTTSSGTAINCSVGNQVVIEEVSTALFRTGIDCNAITGAKVQKCFIDSTDDNAAAMGINLGLRGRASDCEVVSGTDNGTGIKLTGVDGRVTNCYVNNFATGINAAAARASIRGAHVDGATTGITLAAVNCRVKDSYVVTATTGLSITSATCSVDGVTTASVTTGVSASGTDTVVCNSTISAATTGVSFTGARSRVVGGIVSDATTGVSLGAASQLVNSAVISTCTTGVSVGAFASCSVLNCFGTGNTTDLSVNTAATLFNELNNRFTTNTFNSATCGGIPRRSLAQTATSSSATPTFTPDPVNGKYIQQFIGTAAGAATVTIANTATDGLMIGDMMRLVFAHATGATYLSGTWGSQYKTPSGANITATKLVAELCVGTASVFVDFRWTGSTWVLMGHSENGGIAGSY